LTIKGSFATYSVSLSLVRGRSNCPEGDPLIEMRAIVFPWRFCFSFYQHGGSQGTGDGKSRRDPQHDPISSNKSVVNRLSRQRVIGFGGGKS
jgi:hypothetical protein